MKLITRMDHKSLRNEAHVELHETIYTLILRSNMQLLNIGTQYTAYRILVDAEVSLLDLIRKSSYTEEINEADRHRRDKTFRGFADAVKSGLNHFDAAKQEAARKIKVVLDNYGNIAAKTLDQETAAIDDLLRELRGGDYPALVNTLVLNEWVAQLDADNQAFKALMEARYGELAQRPTARMKAARKEVDKAFLVIVDHVEALATINGAASYEPFIRELNVILERYKNILAQERGQRKAKNDKTDEDTNE